LLVSPFSVLGVWTLEQKGEEPRGSITFDMARPSATHLALVALESAGEEIHDLHLLWSSPEYPTLSTISSSSLASSNIF